MKSPRPLLLAFLFAIVLSPAIAATEATIRPGKFAWVDLVTTDPDAAIKFYTETFGWTAQEVQGGRQRYTFLLNNGQPVAGVAYRRADADRAGARWVGSIAVADIEAAVKSVTAAGGRVLVTPRQIEGRGLQALVADPEGCIFGLITREGGGRDSDAAENEWVWAQLLSGKPAAAIEFYRNALGYQIDEDTRSKRADDYLLSRDGYSCAGLTPLPAGQGTRAGWLGYLRVADTAETIEAAKALGARVLYLQDAPDRLQVAILADPLGGAIGIVSMPAAAATKEAK
jgi:predicted enzyme related to lactoylglutathione lyase